MKKLLKKFKENPSALNLFAMAILVYAANTRCAWIAHQPKMPEDVRKFGRR